MTRHQHNRWFLRALVFPLGLLLWDLSASATETTTMIPAPVVDAPSPGTVSSQKAVLAGGCFWGVQAVFQHVKGIKSVLSGYSGGSKEDAQYETVSSGQTGHAESVEIRFDPSVITYGKILQIYFSVAHDPTELNRQGPDRGRQYRSAIFTTDETQKRIAETYISQLDKAGAFKDRIVTEVKPLAVFYPAENYHQDYATLHPDNPYISHYDLPKLQNLRQTFPDLYRPEPVLVSVVRGTN